MHKAQDRKYCAKGPWAAPAPSLRTSEGRSSPGVTIPHEREAPGPDGTQDPSLPVLRLRAKAGGTGGTELGPGNGRGGLGQPCTWPGGQAPRGPQLLWSHAQVRELRESGSYRKPARPSWKSDGRAAWQGNANYSLEVNHHGEVVETDLQGSGYWLPADTLAPRHACSVFKMMGKVVQSWGEGNGRRLW